MSIVVNTPTGNIGRTITERLLSENASVTVLVRDAARVARFEQQGATVICGSLEDGDFVKRATEGAEALFWLTPPPFEKDNVLEFQTKLGRNCAEAVEANGIDHVVHLSSIGAQHAERTGLVKGLHVIEKLLNGTARNIVHLRAGFFMENYLQQLSSIAATGNIFMPVPGRTTLPMVCTADIGEVAASRLLHRQWSGQYCQGVHGPDDLSFDEAAAQIGKGIGRHVQHVEVTPEEAREAVSGMGLSADCVDQLIEMYDAVTTGYLDPEEVRTPGTTTPTTMEEFAGLVLLPVLRGASQGGADR